jgi:hypothetical protein
MKTSWQSESGGLVCRWSALLDDESNSPITLRASTEAYASFMPPMPDFVTHSLLGSGEWYVPWNLRWSVSRSSSMEYQRNFLQP